MTREAMEYDVVIVGAGPSGLSAAVFSGRAFWFSLAIFAVCAALAFRKLHPILIICLAAALGLFAGYVLGLPVSIS